MPANAEEKLRDWLVMQIAQIRPIESDAVGQCLRQVEAERQLPLEPRFNGVAVRRNNLWLLRGGKSRDVLVAGFSHQSGLLGQYFAGLVIAKLHEPPGS